jgi:PKD repeat protein
MKKFLLISFVLLMSAKSFAQSITVSGHVFFQSSFPVADVSVSAIGQNGLPYFGVTDSLGFYSIVVAVPASYTNVEVQVTDFCTVLPIIQFAPIVNNFATSDFEICQQIQTEGCNLNLSHTENSPLSYSFTAESVDFSGNLADNVTYSWNFGDGTSSTEQNPTHVFASSGWYDVYAIAIAVTGTDTCISSGYIFINAFIPYTGPTKTVTIIGYVINEVDSIGIPYTYISAYNPINPWFQDVVYTDSVGFYNLTIEIPDTVNVAEVSVFDCTGLQITHPVYLVNNKGYSDFYICYQPFPTFDCYAYFNYGQIDSLQYRFTANTWPIAPSDHISFLWDFGDGNTSTEESPIHTYSEDNVYIVSLTTVDSSGCTAYASDVICTFNNGSIDSFYYGCQAMFFASNPDPSNYFTFIFEDYSFTSSLSWSWDFGDGNTSTVQNPTHTYQNDGYYDVTLTVTSIDGCESSITMGIFVGVHTWNEWDCQAMYLPMPNGETNGFFFLDFSSSPSQIQSWLWDFGDGNTSTEQNPTHTYSQAGIYSVSLSIQSVDSCSSIISFDLDTENPLMFNESGNVVPVLGLNSLATNSTRNLDNFGKIELFPNPTSSDITVKMNIQSEQEMEISINDVSGKRILTKNQSVNAGEQTVNLDVNDLIPGVYFLQIRSEKGAKSMKFVKI